MLSLILILIMACVLVWAAREIIGQFNLGPAGNILYVLIVVAVVLWVVNHFFY